MENLLYGFIAGLGASFGLGGGTILILLLNFFTNIKQYEIQGINLIFFIPTSLIAIYINYKNKLINIEIAKKCIIFGILGSLIGSYLASVVDTNNLRKYFGIFLIIIAINGIYTFILQYKKDKKSQNKTTNKNDSENNL